MNEQQENNQEEYQVKVIANYKIANYLIKKGYNKIDNYKKHRNYYSAVKCEHCGREFSYENPEKSVLVFIVEDGFLNELDYAINNYDEI